ncbi:helix-turn-helix transcriptional regulator, partial [Pseudomonas psychrophila]|uniref:helix-turn-helix transcriptional regulator n=1 Tax=Pseudomonas psychrophila TaxID=122355 RepID=UPI00178C79D3
CLAQPRVQGCRLPPNTPRHRRLSGWRLGWPGVSQQTIQAYESGKRRIQVAALPELSRLLATTLEELFDQQQETTVRKRGPAPKWQQQLEAIDQLPKSQQKFVAQMLDALIAQATTKASSEGREVLQ